MSRVPDEGYGEQGRVQLGGRAAKAWSLSVVDVNTAVVLQIQALVEANRRAIEHTTPYSPQRSGKVSVSVSLVAAMGL